MTTHYYKNLFNSRGFNLEMSIKLKFINVVGILHNSGTTYKQLKLLLDNATKHCYPGIREKSLDNHIYTEIEAISNSLHEIASEGKSVQMDRLVHESFTNLLYAMIFGTSLRYGAKVSLSNEINYINSRVAIIIWKSLFTVNWQ